MPYLSPDTLYASSRPCETFLQETPMKWITRENAAVDRIACPWLIRRFVDPDAEFLYVPADRVQEIGAQQGATRFDVAGAKLGHVDGRCSFESIVLEYGLTEDPALMCLARTGSSAGIAEQGSVAAEASG